MKRFTVLFFTFLILSNSSLFSAAPDFSGLLDSTVNYTAGAADAPAHSWGLEEYANIRLRLKTGEKAIFNAAFNLIALAGNYAIPALGLGAVKGDNYAAALELERLYFRINGDYADTEAGLLRMGFGYGYVFGSMDFLNPRNPLFPNARLRGVLGANVSFYPADSLKLMAFFAAPRDPEEMKGYIPGLGLEQHWDRLSIQGLYAYQTPLSGSDRGIHRFGLSLKADLELGFAAEVLYTLKSSDPEGIEGLSGSLGFDYSFLGGDLYILSEYLFNGSSSVTARDSEYNLTGWKNHHYLYGTVLYRFSDYCSLALSALFCLDDLSFQPMASFDYEFFQGFSLNITVRVPLDRSVFSNAGAGELGPVPPHPEGSPAAGAKFIMNAGVRLRF